MGDLVAVACSILRQPNVWVAFALFCVGSMTQVSRVAKARGWPKDGWTPAGRPSRLACRWP